MIERSRTTAGYDIVEGPPKTAAGRRAVALDKQTIKVLRGAPSPSTRPAGPRCRGWHGMDRLRVCIHPHRRVADQPELRHHPLPQAHPTHRAATGAVARPAPRRRVPRPRGRRGPEDRSGSARPLEHRRHRRHLHQCPARGATPLRRRHREPRPRRGPPHPKKIKNKARKNRPARRPRTGAPTPTVPPATQETQARRSQVPRTQPEQVAPASHPRDTQRSRKQR
jgi:hypothetical protein